MTEEETFAEIEKILNRVPDSVETQRVRESMAKIREITADIVRLIAEGEGE